MLLPRLLGLKARVLTFPEGYSIAVAGKKGVAA